MAIDLDASESINPEHYAVCIVGAGAAGITLALSLAKANKRVALCEGGSLDFSDRSQDCYIGEVIGDPYFTLDTARLRYFGGSTNHWAGWCRTFDEIDYDRSSIMEHAKWPIQKSDLEPYFAEACAILEVPTPNTDVIVNQHYGIRRLEFQFSPPVRFGEKYLDTIEANPNIDLFLNASLLSLDAKDRAVSSAVFAGYSGKTMRISADRFVMAMGGIENSRQLLWQQVRAGEQLFSASLPVGQYWMEHPHFDLGEALVGNDISWNRFYGITDKAQRHLGVFNCGLRLESQGGTATRRLIRDLLCVAPKAGEWAAAMAKKHLICGVTLRAAWEQAPVSSNRICLSRTAKDEFGVPHSVLHWKKGDVDRRTIEVSANHFNLWLLEENLGRVRLNKWIYDDEDYPADDELAGNHHMGGTRMSSDPRWGVVDANCRVHGTRNLYVAGSSVFATSGHNNPTLPLVQLALRLGDHMARL